MTSGLRREDDSERSRRCQTPRRWRPVLSGLVLAGLAGRLATLPRVPDEHDSFLFVRAVERFAVGEARPHWPGYPVYVWLGKLLQALVGDPLLALHLLSAAASALVAWPLASVARSEDVV